MRSIFMNKFIYLFIITLTCQKIYSQVNFSTEQKKFKDNYYQLKIFSNSKDLDIKTDIEKKTINAIKFVIIGDLYLERLPLLIKKNEQEYEPLQVLINIKLTKAIIEEEQKRLKVNLLLENSDKIVNDFVQNINFLVDLSPPTNPDLLKFLSALKTCSLKNFKRLSDPSLQGGISPIKVAYVTSSLYLESSKIKINKNLNLQYLDKKKHEETKTLYSFDPENKKSKIKIPPLTGTAPENLLNFLLLNSEAVNPDEFQYTPEDYSDGIYFTKVYKKIGAIKVFAEDLVIYPVKDEVSQCVASNAGRLNFELFEKHKVIIPELVFSFFNDMVFDIMKLSK